MDKLLEVASTHEKRFMIDLEKMNIKSPIVGSRSSQYIDETIKFIGKIMEKEYGYTSNSCVYFNWSKFYQQHGYLQLPSDRTNDIDALSAALSIPDLYFQSTLY
jgi:cysteinyl-tRNA synthetase